MKKYRVYLLLSFVAFVSISLFYVERTYLFNPVTFREDEVTSLPWSWYKKPVQVEYLILDDSWRGTIIADEVEAKAVFEELKAGSKYSDLRLLSRSPQGRRIMIIIRRLNDQANILVAEGYEDLNYVELGTPQVYIQLTDKLQELLKSRLRQAK